MPKIISMSIPNYRNDAVIPYYEFIHNDSCIAGFSTRKGGKSKSEFAGLNLGLNTEDNPENVENNRRSFFQQVAPYHKVMHLTQTHSGTVLQVEHDFKNGSEADAFYTTNKHILLTITTADCGAILLHDADYRVAAAIHCGWHGAKQEIIERTIAEISHIAPTENFIAYIAPMILVDNYEVGTEFLHYFDSQYLLKKEGKLYFDLNKKIVHSLQYAGIKTIHNSHIDTYTQSELFYSYRKNNTTGRLCSFIGLQ